MYGLVVIMFGVVANMFIPMVIGHRPVQATVGLMAIGNTAVAVGYGYPATGEDFSSVMVLWG